MTSRDVDNELQHRFKTKKIGHLGTLDPFATGLLVIGVNKGTKFLPYLDDSQKSYIASLELGKSTSTGDPEGEFAPELPIPELDDKAIASALASFLGKGEQLPPMTSAVKVNGQPLYKAAHEGKEIERTPRAVEIFSLHLISYQKPVIIFTATVSRGTYLRVLGQDISKKLGTQGYLTSLKRTSIGPFLLEGAKKLKDVTLSDIVDPTFYLTGMKHVEVDETDVPKIQNGEKMTLAQDYGEKVLLVRHEVALAVYYRLQGVFYAAERGLF